MLNASFDESDHSTNDLSDDYCKEDIKADPEGGDIIDLNHVECDVTPSEIVYLLVPIWVCKYTYHGKKRYVYINGQTGKVDGEVLFANHNYEMNIGMYSVSCFISALSVLLLGTSVFFGGVTSFFISRSILRLCSIRKKSLPVRFR